MSDGDDWWPHVPPTPAERVMAAIVLVPFLTLILSAHKGWRLLGAYDALGVFALGIFIYAVVARQRAKVPDRQQEARHAQACIRAYLDGFATASQWEDFTTRALFDPQVDDIRRQAGAVASPSGHEERALLEALAEEAERFARP